MKKLDGNVRFFAEFAGRCMGIAFITSLLLSLMVGLEITVTDSYGEVLLNSFLVYFLVVGAFVLLICQMSIYQVYLPIILSMGCTRRRFLGGVMLYKLCYCALLLGLYGIGQLMLADAFGICDGKFWMVLILGLLVLTGIGDLLMAANLRFGKIGLLFTVIVCGGFGAAVGLLMSNAIPGSAFLNTMSVWMTRVSGSWPAAFGAAILMCVFGALAIQLALKHYVCRS